MSNSRFAKHAITANCQFQWNFHSKAHKKLSEITHRVKYISILNCELQMYYRRITTKSTPEIKITSDGSFCVRSFLSFHLFGAFFFLCPLLYILSMYSEHAEYLIILLLSVFTIPFEKLCVRAYSEKLGLNFSKIHRLDGIEKKGEKKVF